MILRKITIFTIKKTKYFGNKILIKAQSKQGKKRGIKEEKQLNFLTLTIQSVLCAY